MSPDQQSAERLTIQLHELIHNGHGDDDHADSLREQLTGTLSGLAPEERREVDDLSGDLAQWSGDEILIEPGVHNVLELKAAWEQRDWHRLRALLVYDIPRVSSDYRAYLRGRAWGELGYHRAAAEFLFLAWKSRPEKDNYGYLAIQALRSGGDLEEAWRRAADVAGGSASATLLYQVAHVLYEGAHRCETALAHRIYERVIEIVDRAARLEQPTIVSVRIAALVNKAFSEANVGSLGRAEETLSQALELDADSDLVLSARGLVLVEAGRRTEALLDFQRAVDAGTVVSWPFVYLAEHAIQKREFRRALDLIDESLRRDPEERVRANLLEWRAIVLQTLGRTDEAVQSAYEAESIEPFNDRISHNLDLIQKARPTEQLQIIADFSPSHMRLTGS